MPGNDIVVEFLAFDGCPLAPRALQHLEQAIDELNSQLNVAVRKVDLMNPLTPERMKRWGSPTILFNGKDISGAQPGDANSCRIYSGPGGVLSAKEIIKALTVEAAL
jgi:hypothetical protein